MGDQMVVHEHRGLPRRDQHQRRHRLALDRQMLADRDVLPGRAVQQHADLRVVQAVEHQAQQVTVALDRMQLQPLARQMHQVEQVDGDEDAVPGDAGIKRVALDDEIDDLEAQADDRGDAQPENICQPVGERDDRIGDMAGDVPRHAEQRREKTVGTTH